MKDQVFIGGGAKYNKLILTTLFVKGHLTVWELANEIAKSELKPKESLYHKAQKIQSVLIRKKGRLEDLVNTEYLKRKKKKEYYLTMNKGFCTAITLFNEKETPESAINIFDDNTSFFAPELKTIFRLFSNISYAQSKERYKEIRKVTTNLLDKGLNFEKISNEEFNNYFNTEGEQVSITLSEEVKNTTPVEATPELKEAFSNLFTKLIKLQRIAMTRLLDISLEFKQEMDQSLSPSNKD
jgi:hypothetical protein